MHCTGFSPIDYHQKYRNLKRQLRILIYENECFLEELKKAQRKLLKVSRDKSFLLDRLLQFESVGSSSSDSEATASSESDVELKPEVVVAKRKRVSSSFESTDASLSLQTPGSSLHLCDVKKKKSRKLPPSKPVSMQQCLSKGMIGSHMVTISSGPNHVTPDHVERHLDAKQTLLDLIPEKTPLTLPVEIFSSEPSALECEMNDATPNESSPNNIAGGISEDDGLIIDLHE